MQGFRTFEAPRHHDIPPKALTTLNHPIIYILRRLSDLRNGWRWIFTFSTQVDHSKSWLTASG